MRSCIINVSAACTFALLCGCAPSYGNNAAKLLDTSSSPSSQMSNEQSATDASAASSDMSSSLRVVTTEHKGPPVQPLNMTESEFKASLEGGMDIRDIAKARTKKK